MFRGLYSGATALDYLERRHQVTASNLAHLNSNGHRRAVFSISEKSGSDGDVSPSPGVSLSTNVDFKTPGRMEPTGRKLDLSIRGDGFFQFQGENGIQYSRNGVVYRNPDGQLQNRDGLPMIGENGPITIAPEISEQEIQIATDGTISANGDTLGKLALVKFDDPRLLESETQIDFRIGQATASAAEDSFIIQGTRELSNAQPVTEMINLIISSRHFEAAQRAIRTISESIQQSLQD